MTAAPLQRGDERKWQADDFAMREDRVISPAAPVAEYRQCPVRAEDASNKPDRPMAIPLNRTQVEDVGLAARRFAQRCRQSIVIRLRTSALSHGFMTVVSKPIWN